MSRLGFGGRSRLIAGFLIVLALPLIAVAIKQTTNRSSNPQILIVITTIDSPKGEPPEISERIATQLRESLSAIKDVRIERLSQSIDEPDHHRLRAVPARGLCPSTPPSHAGSGSNHPPRQREQGPHDSRQCSTRPGES